MKQYIIRLYVTHHDGITQVAEVIKGYSRVSHAYRAARELCKRYQSIAPPALHFSYKVEALS